MARSFPLTERESTLRSLLLDVSQYIHVSEASIAKPELRFAGGWVRDKLLGTESHDIDIAIDNMTGEKFGKWMKQFVAEPDAKAKYGEDIVRKIETIEANPNNSKHLETATTKILGLEIDLVNLRKETYTEESRNPQIKPGTAEEDAFRRDATVNALFYNLQSDKIEDLTGRGFKDMELKVIRTPLPPFQTFKDDPLRVLRCIRFACRLGYSIDAEVLQAMSDRRITDAFRAKITRERVGDEVEKMIRGKVKVANGGVDVLGNSKIIQDRDPRRALELIDQQGLYLTVFQDPASPELTPSVTYTWSVSYNFLSRLLNGEDSDALSTIRSVLVTSEEDKYYAWYLCSFLPWGRDPWPQELKLTSKPKRRYPAAAVVGQKGLKLSNKLLDVLINAIDHYEDVEATKALSLKSAGSKPDMYLREKCGVAIRRWGPQWRSTVMYCLMYQVMQGNEPQATQEYTSWLSMLRELGLLQAFSLRPLVDGSEVMTALQRRGGPWLAEALNAAVSWQLRNPESDDKNEVIRVLKEQFGQ